jgi:hypothetical protein
MWLVVAVLGYLVPTLLAYFFLLKPMFDESEAARLERVAADEYLILKNAANQLAQFKERVGVRNNVRRFQASFDSLLAATGVSLVAVRPDTTIEPLKAGFMLRKYNLVIEGYYPQLNNFIGGLEQQNEYFIVSNLAVMRTDNQTGRAQAQVKMLALTVPEQ